MSCKRTHEEIEYEPNAKRKLDDIQLLSSDGKHLPQQLTTNSTNNDNNSVKCAHCDEELMECDESQTCCDTKHNNNNVCNTNTTNVINGTTDDDEDTDPDIIIPYLHRFQESYQSSLSIYSSRLDKLELSDALKCTNELFTVAIDNYEKEHQNFVHNTQIDLSGIDNVRREFDILLIGNNGINGVNRNHSHNNTNLNENRNLNVFAKTSCDEIIDATFTAFDDKLAKVIAFMCEIESKICADMKQIYVSYEKLLEDLIMIEYRLAVIIEMFHHMTDIDPQKFLPSLPFIQNVPDLIGYINSLYDEQNELNIKDESTNERMQAIINQFRAMHKRIRDAMDGLHALSCIIMEKKTEVIDRVHTFYKKAEQIFFSQPSFMFQIKDNSNRCL